MYDKVRQGESRKQLFGGIDKETLEILRLLESIMSPFEILSLNIEEILLYCIFASASRSYLNADRNQIDTRVSALQYP